MIDQQIEDWKKVDDMDGPLSWALCVRIDVDDYSELEEKRMAKQTDNDMLPL